MASSLINVCRFNPTAGGTTDWTYSSAIAGYQGPAAAGALNGATYSYRAESADLTQWEIGTGPYDSGTGTFSRATVLANSSGTTSKINFSAAPQVAIVALAEDLNAPGRIIDSATALLTTYTTIGTSGGIPLDDTIPQDTEGTFVIEATITPKSTSSRLRCRFSCSINVAVADNPIVAMFATGDSNAKVAREYSTSAGFSQLAFLETEFVPGVTTPVTVFVRANGLNGTIYINGGAGGRRLGGANNAALVIEEIVG